MFPGLKIDFVSFASPATSPASPGRSEIWGTTRTIIRGGGIVTGGLQLLEQERDYSFGIVVGGQQKMRKCGLLFGGPGEGGGCCFLSQMGREEIAVVRHCDPGL